MPGTGCLAQDAFGAGCLTTGCLAQGQILERRCRRLESCIDAPVRAGPATEASLLAVEATMRAYATKLWRRLRNIGHCGPGARFQLRALAGMTAKSVKKKMKQASFAAAVPRADLLRGADELDVDFDQHLQFCIDALASVSEKLGFNGAAS